MHSHPGKSPTSCRFNRKPHGIFPEITIAHSIINGFFSKRLKVLKVLKILNGQLAKPLRHLPVSLPLFDPQSPGPPLEAPQSSSPDQWFFWELAHEVLIWFFNIAMENGYPLVI